MARKKITKNQLRQCLELVTDNEKLRNTTMNLADERMDSKYRIAITDVEEVFLKGGGNYSLLSGLLLTIQNMSSEKKVQSKPKKKEEKKNENK